MVEKACNRCNKNLEEGEEELCTECDQLVSEAIRLTNEDKKVKIYYEKVIKEQQKAEIRLRKLHYIYNNDKYNDVKHRLVKKTGEGLVKLYKLNILDAAVNGAKKIFQKEGSAEIEMTEEEMILDEIAELEDFISYDPIEYVIYEFLTEKEEDNNDSVNDNLYLATTKEIYNKKFLTLSRKQQNIYLGIFLGITSIIAIILVILL